MSWAESESVTLGFHNWSLETPVSSAIHLDWCVIAEALTQQKSAFRTDDRLFGSCRFSNNPSSLNSVVCGFDPIQIPVDPGIPPAKWFDSANLISAPYATSPLPTKKTEESVQWNLRPTPQRVSSELLRFAENYLPPMHDLNRANRKEGSRPGRSPSGQCGKKRKGKSASLACETVKPSIKPSNNEPYSPRTGRLHIFL